MAADPTRARTNPGSGLSGRDAAVFEIDAVRRSQLARLAQALEHDVIPRLVRAHRPADGAANAGAVPGDVSAAEVAEFAELALNGEDGALGAAVATLRERGIGVEAVYLELLAPTAHLLGRMWEDDLCHFSAVTVALGRMQRLLRELSPAFGREIEHPPHGRRALFVQPRDEQHSFGLSMVAEFFRREGWDVVGGVGGTITDPGRMVGEMWVDVLGFSIGSDLRLPWLQQQIEAARQATRNPDLVVMVGGPPFLEHPEFAREAGADATARDARDATRLAEELMSGRSHGLAATG